MVIGSSVRFIKPYLTQIQFINALDFGKVLWNERYLSRDVNPEVGGHVGVEVAEAVEGAEGEVEQEPAHDGQHPRPVPTLHHTNNHLANNNIF